jgi:MinD-like ATPase involved in chromosome partitioning or flagellar assembly
MIKKATQFVTFYSYKGGVGRTSALVNAAVLRALDGNNVVVIDFDLEAPGIAQYVRRIDSSYNDHKSGIIEYFSEIIDGAPSPSLRDRVTDLSDCLNGKNGGHLWLLSAGNTYDPGYTTRLEKLKWSDIFENKFGEMMLQNMKNQIVVEFENPDYVFIDSRTGITETGGVCTRYLADKLVILTSLNEQNINGTALIHKELVKEKKECVLVATNVPVGMPNGKNQLFSVRIDAFKTAFGRVPDLIVYHYPLLSLSEEVPALALTRKPDRLDSTVGLFDTDPLLESYRKLSRVIAQSPPGQLSFDRILSGAAHEMMQASKSQQTPEEILKLKEYFSNRYLAQIVIKSYDVLKHCVENPNEPTDWMRGDYIAIIGTESEITNRAAKEVIRVLRTQVTRLLRGHLSEGGKMEASFEAFLDERSIDHVLTDQISRNNYEWPIDYMRRHLATIRQDQHLEKTVTLFNLSHCLLKTGDTTNARSLLNKFTKEFGTMALDEFPPETLANFYFCAALAYDKVGRASESMTMREQCSKQLALVPKSERVFSPIDYTSIPVELFANQFEQAFKADAGLLKKKRTPRRKARD